MDELTQKVYVKHVAQEAVKNSSKLELRGLQLMAYAHVLKAVRATGKLNEKNKKFVGEVMDFFEISEERHSSECRKVAADPGLCQIAERLQGDDGIESWRTEGYGIFPPLPPFHRRAGRLQDCLAKEAEPPPDDVDEEQEGMQVEDVSDTEEYKMAATIWNSKKTKIHKKVQTSKIALKKENVSSDEETSDEKVKQTDRERSPDITEAPPVTPTKNKTILRETTSIKRARGAKRKIPMMISRKQNIITNNEPPPKILKKTNLKHKRALKFPNKVKAPKIKFVRKRPTSESSDRASSDEEDISSKNNVIMNDTIKIRPPTMRGRGLSRVRGRGVRGRGAGRGRMATNVNHHEPPRRSLSESEERVQTEPKITPPSPTKTLKVLKPKKPKTVSVSRRKSRLKEKEDDEMQMEWNDCGFDDDRIIMSNKRMPIKKRKHFPDESCKIDADPGGNDTANRDRDDVLPNMKEEKRENGELDDNCHLYDSCENDRHSVTSDIIGFGRGDRDASSSRHSGNYSGEETDSASEKGSISGSRSIDSSGNGNNNSRVSLSPPPVKPKQRLKTPLTLNVPSSSHNHPPQLPRINLPPPVFSTSLSNVQKKRPKHISVVDSLNLHLPTTATASSLAASSSSRRPSIMGGSSGSSGCSIFSNSQALLANSRGGPGILQQQRKAHPHILGNSKVHQRSFIPTTISSNNNVNVSSVVSINSVNISNNNSVSTSAGTIMSTGPGVHQVQTTVMSSISSAPAAAAVMQLPGISGTPITMGGTIPIGTMPVNRTPGTNIIFLQKASSTPNAVTSSVVIPTNSIPVKTPSRAVILRRTQLPRQGNVMILDVQKNQVVNAGQVPQFLQTRILNPATELSMLNLQSVQAPRKILQSQSLEHSEPTIAYSMAPVHNQRKTKATGIQLITPSAPNNITETFRPSGHVNPSQPQIKDIIPVSVNTTIQSQRDSQMAEIEAQLMQMEEEIVYEEEVITSSDTSEFSTTYTPLRDPTCGSNQVNVVGHKEQPYSIGVNSVNMANPYVSGSSTDTASEGETSFSASVNNTPEILKNKSVEVSLTKQLEVRQMSDALTRAIVAKNSNSTPKRNVALSNIVVTNNENSGTHNPENCLTQGEDIFQTALKSSGIVFTEQQFYSTEEGMSTANVEQLQPANQVIATNKNYATINRQGNGASMQ